MFWGLLDEAYGEDGQQFVFHCLSIALSLSGKSLVETVYMRFGLEKFTDKSTDWHTLDRLTH